jgi:hypothetical protein
MEFELLILCFLAMIRFIKIKEFMILTFLFIHNFLSGQLLLLFVVERALAVSGLDVPDRQLLGLLLLRPRKGTETPSQVNISSFGNDQK